ncbi:MFS transporter [Orbaceae bacterium ESL0727]|nr:MFS transporter [Orbaceae bacterium ESL0727]
MKNRYLGTSVCLYINYFVHGMGAIILGLNVDYLAAQFNPEIAYLFTIAKDLLTPEQTRLISQAKGGVYDVMVGLGVGRLLVLFIMGTLSDKFGRKPFIFLGGLFYIGFLLGILVSPNVHIAFMFAVLGGIANSTLDAGTYPALMEAFPKSPGSASILTKAAIAAGQSVLPIIMGLIMAAQGYYGWSFFFCCAILLINALVVLKMPFPNYKITPQQEEKDLTAVDTSMPTLKTKANFWIEGICFILIGFTSTATFYLVSSCLKDFSQTVAGMDAAGAGYSVSAYGIGTLASVFLTAFLVKSLVRPVYIVVLYPLLSTLMLITLYLNPTPMMCVVAGFVLGFTAAGGVLQLALTTMAEFFPSGKGKVLGIFFTSSSVATATIPFLIGYISKNFDLRYVMLSDAVIAGFGTLLAVIVLIRYRTIFNFPKKSA